MIDANKMWKMVLEDLQVSLSPASFKSWIAPLAITNVSEAGDSRLLADIDCPSSFHLSIVEQRFYGQVQEAFGRVTKKTVELRLSINAAPAPATTDDAGPLFSSAKQTIDEKAYNLHRVGLREDFTFDTFAVSSSNEMAHAAAQAVAQDFGNAYNPLFLYGGVGVGKTHLMQAIAIKVLEDRPKTNMIFCMGEEFTNEIIDAIQQKTTRQFKKRYREVKGLFIDDIQFIAGKTTVQEEFFHTFNAILKAGGQVIMTSDQPPSAIKQLEDRLRSRFEAGLIVDIGKPDFELRTAIVRIKAQHRNIHLAMNEAQIIAANIESARKIEGFLVRLQTESKLRNKTIDETLINSLLGKARASVDNSPPPLRPLEIVKGVSDYFNVPSKMVRGTNRSKTVVTPRHIAMYLLRTDYNIPLTEIGSLFSNRDHTTVMHAVDKVTRELKDSQNMRHDLGSIRKQLYSE